MPPTRSDFQTLAQLRIRDGEVLLKAGNYSGCYYLSGYAIECALKACIARRIKEFEFPPKWNVVRDSYYTHELPKLLIAAELNQEFEQKKNSDPKFDASWTVVKDWSEESRYNQYNEKEAQDFFEAVTDPTSGIFTWLSTLW